MFRFVKAYIGDKMLGPMADEYASFIETKQEYRRQIWRSCDILFHHWSDNNILCNHNLKRGRKIDRNFSNELLASRQFRDFIEVYFIFSWSYSILEWYSFFSCDARCEILRTSFTCILAHVPKEERKQSYCYYACWETIYIEIHQLSPEAEKNLTVEVLRSLHTKNIKSS